MAWKVGWFNKRRVPLVLLVRLVLSVHKEKRRDFSRIQPMKIPPVLSAYAFLLFAVLFALFIYFTR
jgi:hypothetical protein